MLALLLDKWNSFTKTPAAAETTAPVKTPMGPIVADAARVTPELLIERRRAAEETFTKEALPYLLHEINQANSVGRASTTLFPDFEYGTKTDQRKFTEDELRNFAVPLLASKGYKVSPERLCNDDGPDNDVVRVQWPTSA